jgi:hypothetical protein
LAPGNVGKNGQNILISQELWLYLYYNLKPNKMEKFKQVATSSNQIDEVIALAERCNVDGTTDTLALCDGQDYGEPGFFVAVEFGDGSGVEWQHATQREAMEQFCSMVE